VKIYTDDLHWNLLRKFKFV